MTKCVSVKGLLTAMLSQERLLSSWQRESSDLVMTSSHREGQGPVLTVLEDKPLGGQFDQSPCEPATFAFVSVLQPHFRNKCER